MSNAKKIIESLQTGDLYGAQKVINNALMIKMGEALEEKLVNFAPSVFNEAKKAKRDYDGDGTVESSSAEFLGSRDKAIKKSMAMKEDWTSDITNGYDLTNFLNQYQQTGQMPPELVAFYQQNPPVGSGKKKKYPIANAQAQTINAGYEPYGNGIQEEWTDQISDPMALANALNTYQNTGQMPPELVAFYQQNPPVQNVKKKKYPIANTQAQTINAGYEPDEDIDSIVESFENDIREIVQEIQEQTGEALSDQEIAEIAQQYLSLIGEMSEEEYDEEEDDEDDIAEALEDGVDRVTYPPRAPSILPSKRPTKPPTRPLNPTKYPPVGLSKRPGIIHYGSDEFFNLPSGIQQHYHQVFGNQDPDLPTGNP
jgi:hypothetical protein